jgi:16S rRNA processing protein RimM
LNGLSERFIVGLVGAPFGLKGFVKVRSLSGETGHLAAMTEVTLRLGGREKKYVLEESAPGPSSIILMKFAGINSPEEAGALNGAEIIAGRDEAAPLKPGEFYIEDLKGLVVVSGGAGEVLGRIAGIIEGGGGDLAEIDLNSGEKRLVPFRKEFFGDIDLGRGTAVLLEQWILE